MNKNIYYQKSLQILDEMKKMDKKSSLLFSVCCGPCSLYPLEMLCEIFDITILYNNSNIFPKEEFDRRLVELKKIVSKIKDTKNIKIKIVVPSYDYEGYMSELRPFKDEPECGTRCKLCYKKRMEAAFKYAKENNFDFFTTSLTSSRQKSSFLINQIGEEVAIDSDKPKYFYSDFKKQARSELGYKIARERGYYLQDYCGCEYSLIDSIKRKEQK